MEEKVGKCSRCGKPIFCMSGFLNGTIDKKDGLLCFTCHEQKSEIENDK